jgi:hypothetical protein
MKNILKIWRGFLTENEVKYSGILKIKVPQELWGDIERYQQQVPSDAVLLASKDLHVTLVHQSILSNFKDKLGKMDFLKPPPIELEDEVWERSSPGKKSWAIRVKNQDDMRNYVKQVMKSLGSQNLNPEPERVFHVSIANLTGQPKDSVR